MVHGAVSSDSVSVLMNTEPPFVFVFIILTLDIMTSIGDRHRPRFWGPDCGSRRSPKMGDRGSCENVLVG